MLCLIGLESILHVAQFLCSLGNYQRSGQRLGITDHGVVGQNTFGSQQRSISLLSYPCTQVVDGSLNVGLAFGQSGKVVGEEFILIDFDVIDERLQGSYFSEQFSLLGIIGNRKICDRDSDASTCPGLSALCCHLQIGKENL